MPPHFHPQSSEPPPDKIGVSFAADVMKRYAQLVFVLRETVSSYTLTTFIESERSASLREAVLILTSQVRSPGTSGIQVRVDAAPGFVSLCSDPVLTKNGITLVVGQIKNINKNPVAEHAIEELGRECLRIQPEGGPLSKLTLALAT